MKVTDLEAGVADSKRFYATTLHSLESVSDEIHAGRRERRLAQLRRAKRSDGSLLYHPLMSSTELLSHDADFTEDPQGTSTGHANPVRGAGVRQYVGRSVDSPPDARLSLSNIEEQPRRSSLGTIEPLKLPTQHVPDKTCVSPDSGILLPCFISPTDERKASTKASNADVNHVRRNAEVLALIASAKQAPVRPFLKPAGSREDFLSDGGGSETESVTSSFASATVLDDEQIESLMVVTGDYHTFLNAMDSDTTAQYRRMSLPAKLGYLKDYVNFEPIWINENDCDVCGKCLRDGDDQSKCSHSRDDESKCSLYGDDESKCSHSVNDENKSSLNGDDEKKSVHSAETRDAFDIFRSSQNDTMTIPVIPFVGLSTDGSDSSSSFCDPLGVQQDPVLSHDSIIVAQTQFLTMTTDAHGHSDIDTEK